MNEQVAQEVLPGQPNDGLHEGQGVPPPQPNDGPQHEAQEEENRLWNVPLAVFDSLRSVVQERYSHNPHSTADERKHIIKQVTTDLAYYAAAAGAVAGAVPFAALLVAIPAELYALIRLRMELIMAIARIQGYELSRKNCYLRILPAFYEKDPAEMANMFGITVDVDMLGQIPHTGEAVQGATTRAARAAGIVLARRIAWERVPANVFGMLRIGGRRFIYREGKRWITFAKILPAVGAVVGGTLNYRELGGLGQSALGFFPWYDVFVSYDWGEHHMNHVLVRRIVELLTAKGLKVWFDNIELRGGHVITEECKKGIDQSKYVIVGVTANYKRKVLDEGDHCGVEFRHVWDNKRKNIIPIRLEDVLVDGGLQKIQDYVYRDLFGLEDHQLVTAVNDLADELLTFPQD